MIGRFYTTDVRCDFRYFTSSCMKKGERRIIGLDELNRLVHLHSRAKRFSSSRRIMRLSPVFTLDQVTDVKTHQTSVVYITESARVR